MSWISLERLLTDARPADNAVAARDSETLSFGRFRADVAGAAARLNGCEKAALACDDAYRFAVGFFALLHVGAGIVLPANTLPGALADLDLPVVDDAWLLQVPARERSFPPLDPEQCRIVFHTSGSTGAPKQIDKTLGMLGREAATLNRAWGECIGAGPVLATVSHQHLYGLAFRLLWPLAAGRCFDAATDAVWETLLPKLRPGAIVVSSPAHLGRLGGIAPVPRDRTPATIFSAGAPLPFSAAADSLALLGRTPTEIFGSTETGAVATRRQIAGDEAWTLLPGNEIRLDADGRMAVRSPYVDGWRQTEDLAAKVKSGLRFLGRADRIVKIEGRRVSMPAVETALVALPWVAEAAVVVLPGTPERLGGALALTESGRDLLAELGRFAFGRLLRSSLAHKLEIAGLPRHWRFVEALPTRAMGKRGDADILALFQVRPK